MNILVFVNLSPTSASYMRRWTGSTLVQVMACRLFGTKPLLKAMLSYNQFNSREQISLKFESEFYHSISRKFILNVSSVKMAAILSRADELIYAPDARLY